MCKLLIYSNLLKCVKYVIFKCDGGLEERLE